MGVLVLVKKRVFKDKVSVQFVLAVLRQHEIELDRLIAEFEFLMSRMDDLTEKIQYFVDNTSDRRLTV
jgi:hypothetical protein